MRISGIYNRGFDLTQFERKSSKQKHAQRKCISSIHYGRFNLALLELRESARNQTLVKSVHLFFINEDLIWYYLCYEKVRNTKPS